MFPPRFRNTETCDFVLCWTLRRVSKTEVWSVRVHGAKSISRAIPCFDSPPILVSGSHSLIMMLTTAQIARVDKTGFVLSTRMWSLLYSKIHVGIF